jgi:hypothetical protein
LEENYRELKDELSGTKEELRSVVRMLTENPEMAQILKKQATPK